MILFTCPFPGLWGGFRTPSGPLPRAGVATYRLLVTLPSSSPDRFAVSVPGAWSAYRLFANGALVAEDGEVAADPAAVRPRYSPAVVPLFIEGRKDSRGQTIELVLQVANYEFRAGGTLKSLWLGPADALERGRRLRYMLQVFPVAAMVMMTVYHGVFFVWHLNKTTLYFAVLTALLALRTSVTAEMPILTIFPGFPWGAHLRIEYVTDFLGTLFFVLFIESLFPLDVVGWVQGVLKAVTAVGSVAALVLPIRFISGIIPAYTVFIGVCVPYFASVLVRAFRNRREASEFFLAGGLIFLTCFVLALLHYNQLWIKFDLLPVGTGVLLISQSLTLARRYALAFRRETALSATNARLLAESQRLLEERRRLYQLLARQDMKVRRDISEMLHGRTQARLHAAWYNAERAAQLVRTDPEEAQRLLATVQDFIDQVREQDIREASHRLHPSALGAGLVPALESLLRPMEGQFGVHLSVDPALDELDEPARQPFSEEVRIGLYRIAEEALNNIRRHAQAKNVFVTLRYVPDSRPLPETAPGAAAGEAGPSRGSGRLELVIADDGVGINVEPAAHGLGLRLIAARTADLGGEWEIGTRPEGGTRLRVVIPLSGELPSPR